MLDTLRLASLATALAFGSWALVVICQKVGLMPHLPEDDPNNHRGALFNYIITAMLVPVLEEFLFRFPLKYLVQTKLFGLWFYLVSAVAFGLVHLINYDLQPIHWAFALLIVSPQMISGSVFGYIRIRHGFWFGVAAHSLLNSIGFALGA